MNHRLLITFIFLLTSFSGWAKKFNNEFIEFDLPPGWECQADDKQWYCVPENKDRQKEAIIIFAGKKRSQDDSIDKYLGYLKKPKSYTMPSGKRQTSDMKFTRQADFNNHRWIDSLHLSSEVPGYFTRYLATTKSEIGTAVTFSVVRNKYGEYKELFENVIKSMRFFSGSGEYQNFKVTKSGTQIPNELLDIAAPKKFESRSSKPKSSSNSDMIFFALLLLGAGGFVYFKKKKQNSAKSNEIVEDNSDEDDVA